MGKAGVLVRLWHFCYLYGSYKLQDALDLVRCKRVGVSPNVGSMAQLCALEKEVTGASTVDIDEYAVDQIWEMVQQGFIRPASNGQLERWHVQEAVSQYGPADKSNGGLLASIDWLESLDPSKLQ